MSMIDKLENLESIFIRRFLAYQHVCRFLQETQPVSSAEVKSSSSKSFNDGKADT